MPPRRDQVDAAQGNTPAPQPSRAVGATNQTGKKDTGRPKPEADRQQPIPTPDEARRKGGGAAAAP